MDIEIPGSPAFYERSAAAQRNEGYTTVPKGALPVGRYTGRACRACAATAWQPEQQQQQQVRALLRSHNPVVERHQSDAASEIGHPKSDPK
ncbi:hypothetical protein [Mesorhizobium captivum]|uniref:hypothetical protein n=1 Tax=Mesorhizobium captivum TaxID=3072319 RepID=UPI002A245467|nr:hypothetical protein [Mesorhizobium sp. VK22B]